MASGIRIAINLNNCAGPLTVKDGALLGQYHRIFSDDTVTWVAVLQESHVTVSAYLDARHVTIDVHMCNETKDNTELARKVGRALSDIFETENVKWGEEKWTSE